MQDLPGDVLLVILHMLALQDPAALVAATCLCQSFRQAAAENPGVWKEAFYGAAAGKGEVPFEDHSEKQSAKLEAEVAALGGLKRLVEARCRTQATCEQSQEGFSNGDGSKNGCDPSLTNCFKGNRLLIIARLNGSILFWSAYEALKDLHTLFPEGKGFEYHSVPCAVVAPNRTAKYQKKLKELFRRAKKNDGKLAPRAFVIECYAHACASEGWDIGSVNTQDLDLAFFGMNRTVCVTGGPLYPVFHRRANVLRQQDRSCLGSSLAGRASK